MAVAAVTGCRGLSFGFGVRVGDEGAGNGLAWMMGTLLGA